MIISSRNNEGIKFVRSLLNDKKARKESSLFIVEGINSVCDLPANVKIRDLYYTSSAMQKERVKRFISSADCNSTEVSDSVMSAISDTVSPSGLVAVVETPASRPVDSDRVIVLDGVCDPGNVGTIIRSAAAFGFGTVIGGEETDFYSPKIVRATMTGLFSVNIVNANIDEMLSQLKRDGYSLIALDMNGVNLNECPLDNKIALIVGSEAHGIAASTGSKADVIASIPMKGAVESLNAAVAASIAMHALMR